MIGSPNEGRRQRRSSLGRFVGRRHCVLLNLIDFEVSPKQRWWTDDRVLSSVRKYLHLRRPPQLSIFVLFFIFKIFFLDFSTLLPVVAGGLVVVGLYLVSIAMNERVAYIIN